MKKEVDIQKMADDLRKNRELFEEIGQKHGNGVTPVTVLDEGFYETYMEYEYQTMMNH